MSEPIWTQVTLAIPKGYGTYPVRDDELRQITEALAEEVYDGEVDEELVAGELWQCSGLANYGLNEEQRIALTRLIAIGVEFDASSESKYEYGGMQYSWRKGWPQARGWETAGDVPALTESEYKTLRTAHAKGVAGTFSHTDALDFISALDGFWPPPLLIERDAPPTSAVA